MKPRNSAPPPPTLEIVHIASDVESPRHNLPSQPTPLIGRETEVARLSALLADHDSQLLTLAGPGGVGKTRLAIAAAERELAQLPDGVWFIDLTPLADPALVVPTIAHVVGVREVAGTDLQETLTAFLRDRVSLLLLDNFEHLLPAAPDVEALLAVCPGLTILATSREPLHLRREQVIEVSPLPVPPAIPMDTWQPAMVEDLLRVPAVALFVERAQAAHADFMVTEANAAAVAEVSLRLDGLPLAVELAAARSRVLSPSALLARVENSLALLRWDAPDVPSRHRTLRATLDWSYDLLSPAEQCVFRRLGVFAGGFTLEAVEAVVAADDLDTDLLDILQGLVDKHLVRVLEGGGDEPRFGLLATMREYALKRLTESDEAEAARDRHLTYFLSLAEQAGRAMLTPEETAWLNRLDREVDNLRLAQDWAIVCGDAETEWRLVAALALFWLLRGYLREGVARSKAARLRAFDTEPSLRSRFLEGTGLLALWSRDDDRAVADFEQSLKAAAAAHDRAQAVHVLGHLSYVVYAQGDAGRARTLIDEMLRLAHAIDSGLDIGYGYVWRVLIAIGPHGSPRERERLRSELDEPVARLREAGVHRDLAELLAGRARLLSEVDMPAAIASLREALELGRGADDPLMFSIVPWLATVILAGRLPAEQIVRLSGGLATLEARSAAIGGRTHIDVFGSPQDRLVLTQAVAAAREELGEAVFAEIDAAGKALTFEELLDAALVSLDQASANAPETKAVGRFESLISPREREVLALVAEGRSNKVIAEALYVAPSTVKTHVASLLTKLDADNRAQLATIAAQRALIPRNAPAAWGAV
jgi:non-specific serine/threonine protein kinase